MHCAQVEPLLGGKYEQHLSPLAISLFLKYAHGNVMDITAWYTV